MTGNLPNGQIKVKPHFCQFGFVNGVASSQNGQMGNRIREWREKRGWGLEKLAFDAGISAGYLSRMEREKRNISLRNLAKLSMALEVSERDLVTNDGGMVPLVGMVSAGADDVYFSDGQGELDEIEAPVWANDATVAVEIRGTSLGRIFDRWIAFYNDRRDPPGDDFVGLVCVCGLDDGRVVIKRMMRGSARGLWHLESATEQTLFDRAVSWAAPVKEMRPR